MTVDLFAALAGPAEEVAPLLLGATIRDDAVAVRIVGGRGLRRTP